MSELTDMDRATLAEIIDRKSRNEAFVIATNLGSGQSLLIEPTSSDQGNLHQAARMALARDACAQVSIDEQHWFLNVQNAPPTLYIVGAVHIAQPLSQLAAIAKFNVVVIDPRTAFATTERFPNLRIINQWPDEALSGLPINARTAIVTLTHDPKLDDPALLSALRSPCFYVGALGSRKTHAARKERLARHGIDEALFARIHGPVGLDIGAVSPAEIAISIMAQIIDRLRNGKRA